MSNGQPFPLPRSGTKKQARQEAFRAGLLFGGAGEGEGPFANAPELIPWNMDTDTVLLDGAGAGEILLPRLGGVRPNEAWLAHRVRVFIAGGRAASPLAIARLYLGDADEGNALDASYNGGEDTAEFPHALVANAGEYWTVAFTAGLAGALARFTIQGVNLLLGA